MRMPDEVYEVFAAVARKFSDLHKGNDDERREATRRGVGTIRARVRGSGVRDGTRWVHKTQHSNGSAPSKDALAFVPEGPIEHLRKAGMYMFDTIDGTTREPNPPGIMGEWGEQYILVVEPQDWLDGNEPPADTHKYIGGGNDTGICDVCGQPRTDRVHVIEDSKEKHGYDGGEHDTGLCDICQKPKADPIHEPGGGGGENEVIDLLRQILESNMRQEQKLEEIRRALSG